ncbi:hypothetical protein R6242_19340 [Iodobacter sp. CM08]|uniref:hypothetical protein n=1 Tax=Iodobacter sp. CM08 TaxID=3085902 RepID=UPI0029812A0A|nr:hypothetical protein [Iodobacter sp. CM08]MDW5418726.1 hypothetical protein [Iodobacter sp. CM08]
MLDHERLDLAKNFVGSLTTQSGWDPSFELKGLIERVLILDTAHLDALGEKSPNGRPVVLADVAEGFDLMLIEAGDLIGRGDDLERVVAEYSIGSQEMKMARKSVGLVLDEIRVKKLEQGEGEFCFSWSSADGSRYVAIPALCREEILESFGISGSGKDLKNYIYNPGMVS